MFSLFIMLLKLPLMVLYVIGEPFKFTPESSMANKSDHRIRQEYSFAKQDHYIPRIGAGIILVLVGTVAFYFLYWTLMIIAVILSVAALVDILLMTARAVFFRTKSKELKKSTGTALALTSNEWKDTGINGILKLAEKQRQEAQGQKEEAKVAHFARRNRVDG